MSNAEQAPHIRPLDLAGPERRLGSAVRAFGQIADRFAKGAKRSLPFLSRQKCRLVPGQVELGPSRAISDGVAGPSYKIYLEAADTNAWALVRIDTAAVAAIVEGALGAGPLEAGADLGILFGKELTVAQRALLAKVGRSIAEDYALAVRAISGLELALVNAEPVRVGERIELPEDVIRTVCAFDGSGVPAGIELCIGAEVLEAVIQETETTEHQAGDPRMESALRGVVVPVVAELGRVTLELRRLLALSPGETLRLETAVGDPIKLRVAGMEKFEVVPVVSRGQLAVQIQDRVRNET